MGGYVTLPAESLEGDGWRPWVARALDHVATMKPK
jgi:hypothetical protein